MCARNNGRHLYPEMMALDHQDYNLLLTHVCSHLRWGSKTMCNSFTIIMEPTYRNLLILSLSVKAWLIESLIRPVQPEAFPKAKPDSGIEVISLCSIN